MSATKTAEGKNATGLYLSRLLPTMWIADDPGSPTGLSMFPAVADGWRRRMPYPPACPRRPMVGLIPAQPIMAIGTGWPGPPGEGSR